MNDSSDSLREKPCRCGGTMKQVIGFSEPDEYRPERYPIRKGWFCKDCKNSEQAILRETTVAPGDWP